MMRSLFAGVSGLSNHQVQMDVIGNNIANVNTLSFKSSRVLFQEMLNQTLKSAGGAEEGGKGGTNPQQAGLGMSISAIDTIFSQGNLMATQKKTDLAIQGDGLFILSDGTNRYYTRAGNFDFDLNGNLVNPQGQKVLGYLATEGTLGKVLEDVSVDFEQRLPANTTTEVSFVGNLDASAELTSTSSTTLVTKLFDEDGNPMNLHIGDKISITGKAITPAEATTELVNLYDSSGTSLGIADGDTITYSGDIGVAPFSDTHTVVAATDTLETLRADLEGKLQTVDPTITVSITSAGKLEITAGSGAITSFKIENTTQSKDIFTFTDITAGETEESNEFVGSATEDISDTYTITSTSNLSDLSSALQSAIRAAGSGNETVAAQSDGSLRVTADTLAIGGLKMECTGKTNFNNYGIIGAIAAGENGYTAEGSRSADYTTFVTTYDSLGNPQIITLLFAKDTETGVSNTWNWQAIVPYSADSPPTGDTNTISFNADGSLAGGDTAQITFDPDGVGGSDEMKIDFNFGTLNKFDGLTQFAAPFSATLKEQNGYTSGTLDDISIDDAGILTGIFTNGINKTLAQIALASFANPAGLYKKGDNLYQQSLNSGLPEEGKPGEGNRGVISPSTLEMSNVDLAKSFTDIIVAQRGFQVNARVITTSDQILQELVNLKR